MDKDGILHDTEKTSAAEQYKREAAKKEKDSLEQKIKKLIQMLENQERAFKIFRVKITGEMRERDNLLRRMNKRTEMLEILRKIREEQEEDYMKKEEQIKREASEREKDPSEQNVEELQRQLENQKRVLERLRARVRKEIREREKTSAAEEWARGEATERGKEPLEQKVKELQSKMEGNRSVFLKGARLKMTKKMRERENLLRRMNKRFEMLEMLGMIKDELGECCKKTDELCDAAKTLAECTEGEPSEKEKELLEQKYKEISQKVEDQKKDFEEFVGKMVEKTRQRQKISAEECVKRVAAEREKELLEQKVKELQEQLEDQERVPEELRVKKTEKQRERGKTSAEMLPELEVAMREKKLLEQMVKKLQQKLKDQERTFERFRDKLTKEMRERDDLLRKMNERIQTLERLLRLPETLEEQDMKKAKEQAKREAAERKNKPLPQKVKELQQKSENQEKVFEVLRVKMTEELNEREKASAEEQAKREAAEREKLLEQKLKELQQKFEDQERAFKAFRVQMTEEERERDNFLRKMNKRIEILEAAVNNDNDKDDEESTEKY
ncbi:trichohyalin-like isoform X6 [Oryx dammah]|uniref:trichohyalin-like isoform X6 n=1 Tax=Oryx dammah TaxID=59534 RepID=UPI001A9A7CB7|nr:trichohyalin-like isoform X6 [Oryx dammah]